MSHAIRLRGRRYPLNFVRNYMYFVGRQPRAGGDGWMFMALGGKGRRRVYYSRVRLFDPVREASGHLLWPYTEFPETFRFCCPEDWYEPLQRAPFNRAVLTGLAESLAQGGHPRRAIAVRRVVEAI